jgi:hypothetical protein
MSGKPRKEYDNRIGFYQCLDCGHQWRANHAIESYLDNCLMCKMRNEADDSPCEPEEDNKEDETFAVDYFFSHCGVEL